MSSACRYRKSSDRWRGSVEEYFIAATSCIAKSIADAVVDSLRPVASPKADCRGDRSAVPDCPAIRIDRGRAEFDLVFGNAGCACAIGGGQAYRRRCGSYMSNTCRHRKSSDRWRSGVEVDFIAAACGVADSIADAVVDSLRAVAGPEADCRGARSAVPDCPSIRIDRGRAEFDLVFSNAGCACAVGGGHAYRRRSGSCVSSACRYRKSSDRWRGSVEEYFIAATSCIAKSIADAIVDSLCPVAGSKIDGRGDGAAIPGVPSICIDGGHAEFDLVFCNAGSACAVGGGHSYCRRYHCVSRTSGDREGFD